MEFNHNLGDYVVSHIINHPRLVGHTDYCGRVIGRRKFTKPFDYTEYDVEFPNEGPNTKAGISTFRYQEGQRKSPLITIY